EDAPRNDGLALWDVGDDGERRAVCDRREDGLSRSTRARDRGRWRDADERQRRARYRSAILETMEGSAVRRHGAREPRLESGDVGAARARGRSEVSRSAERRSEEHTSELQSRENLVCRLLRETQ